YGLPWRIQKWHDRAMWATFFTGAGFATYGFYEMVSSTLVNDSYTSGFDTNGGFMSLMIGIGTVAAWSFNNLPIMIGEDQSYFERLVELIYNGRQRHHALAQVRKRQIELDRLSNAIRNRPAPTAKFGNTTVKLHLGSM